MQAMEMRAEQESGIGVGCQKGGKVFEIYFFCSGTVQNISFFLSFFPLFLWGVEKVTGRQIGVGRSGHGWWSSGGRGYHYVFFCFFFSL